MTISMTSCGGGGGGGGGGGVDGGGSGSHDGGGVDGGVMRGGLDGGGSCGGLGTSSLGADWQAPAAWELTEQSSVRASFVSRHGLVAHASAWLFGRACKSLGAGSLGFDSGRFFGLGPSAAAGVVTGAIIARVLALLLALDSALSSESCTGFWCCSPDLSVSGY